MTDFEIMQKMSEDNKDIRMFPISSNFIEAKTGKDGWGEVIIAVNNGTVIDLINGNKLVGALYLLDSDEWKKIKEGK